MAIRFPSLERRQVRWILYTRRIGSKHLPVHENLQAVVGVKKLYGVIERRHVLRAIEEISTPQVNPFDFFQEFPQLGMEAHDRCVNLTKSRRLAIGMEQQPFQAAQPAGVRATKSSRGTPNLECGRQGLYRSSSTKDNWGFTRSPQLTCLPNSSWYMSHCGEN